MNECLSWDSRDSICWQICYEWLRNRKREWRLWHYGTQLIDLRTIFVFSFFFFCTKSHNSFFFVCSPNSWQCRLAGCVCVWAAVSEMEWAHWPLLKQYFCELWTVWRPTKSTFLFIYTFVAHTTTATKTMTPITTSNSNNATHRMTMKYDFAFGAQNDKNKINRKRGTDCCIIWMKVQKIENIFEHSNWNAYYRTQHILSISTRIFVALFIRFVHSTSLTCNLDEIVLMYVRGAHMRVELFNAQVTDGARDALMKSWNHICLKIIRATWIND